MKAIYLRKWLKGLRSGAYARGRNQLVIPAGEFDDMGRKSKNDRFCCLGVLADVLGYEMTDNRTVAKVEKGDYYACDGALPPKIADKMGLTWEQQEMLGQLNDSGETTVYIHKETGEVRQHIDFLRDAESYESKVLKAKSFKGIAQIIERLFT